MATETKKSDPESRSYEVTGELIRRLLDRLERGAQRWNGRGELVEGGRQ
jgi:hypothetical protein